MSVIWLRVAAALYSVGLLHALVTTLRRRTQLLGPAFGAFSVGATLHLVSIIEEAALTGHFPANNFYESVSLCAFLLAVLYLLVYWRYRFEGLSVFMFPLVFVLTLLGTLGSPVGPWVDTKVRDAWLLLHVLLVLVGYAAMLLMAASSLVYLLRERQLKKKTVRAGRDRWPPLGTLDELISQSMAVGFLFITLAVIAGSTWAFIESGTRWIHEARIVISLITWGFYLVLVFLRVSAGWRGRKAAILALVVLVCSALTWAAHSGLRDLLAR